MGSALAGWPPGPRPRRAPPRPRLGPARGPCAGPPRGHLGDVAPHPHLRPRPVPPDQRPAPAPPNPAGPRCPRGVHPEVHRLSTALLGARERLPYATAEARLLDGLQRWVRLESTSPAAGVSLAPVGPRWAAVLAAVRAVARLCSAESAGLLAPWVVQDHGAGAGVSPSASVSASFVAFVGEAGGAS